LAAGGAEPLGVEDGMSSAMSRKRFRGSLRSLPRDVTGEG
jgi:hypothetical protein